MLFSIRDGCTYSERDDGNEDALEELDARERAVNGVRVWPTLVRNAPLESVEPGLRPRSLVLAAPLSDLLREQAFRRRSTSREKPEQLLRC